MSTLVAPTADFLEVLTQIGQSITIRAVTRTIDANGTVTAISTVDTVTTAVVQEVSAKERIFLQLGLCNIGDVMFFVAPATVVTIYDSVIWNATTFKVRKVMVPPRIDAQILFKQLICVQDSGNFPT